MGHTSAAGDLGLGQAHGQAAFADGTADAEGALGFGVAVAVLGAGTAVPGEVFVGVVACSLAYRHNLILTR